MLQPLLVEQPKRPSTDLKGFSCAERECSFVAPVRGKRRRTKPPRETLHARLRRYEEMLKSYGAKIEPCEDFDGSDTETDPQSTPRTDDGILPKADGPSIRLGSEDGNAKFIMKEGASRYFDSALWSHLSADFQHPEATNFTEPGEDIHIDEGGLFFEPESSDKAINLTKLHPPWLVLEKLKDVFIDRVDPMMKILHIPTFWAALTNGLQRPHELPKSLEALLFSFYLVTISTLKEEESQCLFAEQHSVVLSRYRIATRQALLNARNTYRCDTLFILSGVAIRLARKMGLHRDGTFLGLPPFETEMRRRIWWHLAHVDFRTADVMGTKPSAEISGCDTKWPINVEDGELSPDMTELPKDRSGITAISLCLIKCEIIETLCKYTMSCPHDLRWEALFSPDVPLAKKDSLIEQVEDHIEKKYLRYYDPSNPLHTFISIIMRSAICKMRLVAHNQRQFTHRSSKASEKDHDIAFFNAMKLLEYANLIQSGHMGLDKYMWQIGTSYLWNTMLYLLIEVRNRKKGPEVDKAWRLIGVVFESCPQVLEELTGSVYMALGKWTLEVWESHVEASKAEGLPEPLAPGYIHEIRAWQRAKMESEARAKGDAGDARPTTRYSSSCDKISYADYVDVGYSESRDFPNLMSFEMDPNQWVQWEQLMVEQSRFL
ncbi:c6 transcription factor [Trichoderma arundinaceum]|uniref:C6 transcription factor n=1 Tax=Trichoderma arundinaceum TaxID=490622 RepID=A0A395NW74_TRIAR|nr:c6 transcription factor [Trichoderma arundinaceum]